MNKMLDEYWIVFEITPEYIFKTLYETEKEAQDHMVLRSMMISNTEMAGRTIVYKRYVVLE